MIIVLSDTHKDKRLLNLLYKAYKNKNIDAIIHCGDIIDFSQFNILKLLTDNIYFVKGNNDYFDFDSINILKTLNIEFSFAPFEFEIKQYGYFVIMHEPYFIKEYESKDYINYIIYGHTHIPKIKKSNGTYIINPGAFSYFLNPIPSFAIIDNNVNLIKRIL